MIDVYYMVHLKNIGFLQWRKFCFNIWFVSQIIQPLHELSTSNFCLKDIRILIICIHLYQLEGSGLFC